MGREIYGISFVLMVLVPCIFGCTKLKYGARAHETKDPFDSDERKVYYSDVVVFGEIGETVVGDYPYKGIEGVSTIKFNVLCTYKAENVSEIPSTIFIAGIGNENGQIKDCPPAPIPPDSKDAIMFLKRTGKPDVFEAEFKPNTHGVEIMLDDLTVVCDLTLHENASKICEDFLPLTMEDGCVKWSPKKVTRPTEAPEPEPESKEENNTDGTVVDIDATEDGKNNQSDQGYETKPEKNKNTGSVVSSSTDDENSSSTIVTSVLVTIVSLFLTIVV